MKIRRLFRVTYILIIILTNTLMAQEITEMFKDLFPAKVFYDQQNYFAQMDALERAKTVHPELIYYEISKMQFFYQENDRLVRQLAFEQTISIRDKFISEKTSWGQTIADSINSSEIPSRLKIIIKKKLPSLILPTSNAETKNEILPMDENLMNFVVWKSYIMDKNLHYDPTITYSGKRSEFEQEKRLQFREISNQIDQNPKKAKLRQSDEFLKWWHLFRTPDDWTSLSKRPDEFIRDVYTNYYSMKNLDMFDIGFSYGIRFNVPIKHTVNDFSYYKAKINEKCIVTPVRLIMSAKIPLRSFISPFSFLNLSIGYTQAANRRNRKVIPVCTITTGKDDTIIIFHDYEIDNIHMKFLTFQASTPIFFLTNRSYIEFGFISEIHFFDYQVKHNLIYIVYPYDVYKKIYITGIDPWTENVKMKKQVIASPILKLTYQTPFHLYFSLNATIHSTDIESGFSF